MKDYVMKGTGNSRYLKSVPNFLSLYPTYEDFVAALVQGNLPIDLNGINASGWSQQGTPLNKANLLSDATGAMLGLGSTGTVNTALAALAKYNQYWWKRTVVKNASQTIEVARVGDGGTGVRYSDTLILQGGKSYLGGNPKILQLGGSIAASAMDVFTGKFFVPVGGKDVYYSAGNGQKTGSGTSSSPYVYTVTGSPIIVGAESYVTSNSISAYPDHAVSGNYYYELLGKPLETFKNERSSFFHYYGTGTYGASGPTVLTFPFEPKMVVIPSSSGFKTDTTYGYPVDTFMWFSGLGLVHIYFSYKSSPQSCSVIPNGNTLSFYNTTAANYQFNTQAVLYTCVAFG